MEGKHYIPVHMHLHSSHEPSGSIGGHMARAGALGVHHLFTTEHDTRMGEKSNAIHTFRFVTPDLMQQNEKQSWLGFSEPSVGGYRFDTAEEGYTLSLWGGAEITFNSFAKRHCDPLLCRPTVTVYGKAEQGARVTVTFHLSQQPPDFEPARLSLPFTGESTAYRLWELVPDSLGGLDNAFCAFSIKVEGDGDASFTLHHVDFSRELNYEQVHREQIELVKRLSEKHGVTA